MFNLLSCSPTYSTDHTCLHSHLDDNGLLLMQEQCHLSGTQQEVDAKKMAQSNFYVTSAFASESNSEKQTIRGAKLNLIGWPIASRDLCLGRCARRIDRARVKCACASTDARGRNGFLQYADESGVFAARQDDVTLQWPSTNKKKIWKSGLRQAWGGTIIVCSPRLQSREMEEKLCFSPLIFLSFLPARLISQSNTRKDVDSRSSLRTWMVIFCSKVLVHIFKVRNHANTDSGTDPTYERSHRRQQSAWIDRFDRYILDISLCCSWPAILLSQYRESEARS